MCGESTKSVMIEEWILYNTVEPLKFPTSTAVSPVEKQELMGK